MTFTSVMPARRDYCGNGGVGGDGGASLSDSYDACARDGSGGGSSIESQASVSHCNGCGENSNCCFYSSFDRVSAKYRMMNR